MRSVRAGALLLATWLAPLAAAQTYPAKSLLVILPMQSATASDVMVRIVAQKMAENMRQAFVIVNLPGAAGLIGAERIANAVPDGYTLGGINDGLITQIPYLYKKVPYDPLQSFQPVSMVATVTYALIAHPSLPAKSLGELVALAKEQPGRIDFASGGNGNAQHLAMELLKAATGTSLTHVPFRGTAQAIVEVMSGRVPVMFSGIAPVLGSIREGKLRALAVPGTRRSPLLPEVPTFAEAGVPGFTFATSTAFYLPRATPSAIVERLQRETAKVLSDPPVRERLLQLGLEPEASTPAQLAALLRSDTVKMQKVIREAQLKAD
jgi:tripartite-type tricarboxylate transporter receptor subunit TctC